MNQQVLEDLVSSLTFVRLPKWNQNLILEEMSTEPVSSKATISQEEAPEVLSMEAMPYVPMAPRSPSSKQSIAKEKQKKPQPIPMRSSPRKNLVEVWQKGRMDKAKKLYETMDLDAEELCDGVEELDIDKGNPITKILAYIPLWKGKTKVTKDPDLGKFTISMPLLLEEVVFEGALLACILVLKLEYWDLADDKKFPHFTTNKYMTKLYYEETRVTKLEPMKWVKGVEHIRFLHMLFVSYFHRTIINAGFVCQFLTLVHNGCLWFGKPIPIIDMLIHKIKKLPYKGADPAKEFKGRSKEKELVGKMKIEFGLVKKSCRYTIHSIIGQEM